MIDPVRNDESLSPDGGRDYCGVVGCDGRAGIACVPDLLLLRAGPARFAHQVRGYHAVPGACCSLLEEAVLDVVLDDQGGRHEGRLAQEAVHIEPLDVDQVEVSAR